MTLYAGSALKASQSNKLPLSVEERKLRGKSAISLRNPVLASGRKVRGALV